MQHSNTVSTTIGNVGLGKQTVLQLVKHNPAHIYLAARNEASAQKAIAEIETAVPGSASRIRYIHCDLADLASVKTAARSFLEAEKERGGGEARLDLLFLNAGIMATPAGLTADGYEMQFGTNHVGHFLLSKLLLPTLVTTAKLPGADVRVVSLSSIGHIFAPSSGISFDELRTPMSSSLTLTRYGQSKLANILFAKELHRRYHEQGITAVAVHPGVVNTELYRNAISNWPLGVGKVIDVARGTVYTSVEDGAKGQLWAATGPLRGRGSKEGKGEVVSGEYYTPVGVPGQGSRASIDAELAVKLWDWSEKEVSAYEL
jgi:NAD(P)-dependent dehydrogenase (short-subunit alcohol dehydrogenase family)